MRKYTAILLGLLLMTISVLALVPPTRVIGDSTFVPYRVIYLKSSPARKLYSVTGYNSGPAQFLMIFNKTNSPPTNGEIATFSFPIATLQGFSFDLSYYGADMDAVVVCNSTTANTNTIGLTNCSFQGVIAQ